jgi:Phage integrase, N-terminal SAM-like domain
VDIRFSTPPPVTSDAPLAEFIDKAKTPVRKAPSATVFDTEIEAAESSPQKHAPPPVPRLLDIPAAADLLAVSTCWVRRHLAEIPHERLGRLIRFDPVLLSRWLKERMQGGKSLKPERAPMPSRYQRGSVYQTGKRKKIWYGMFSEDICTPDGQIERRQRKIRLGSLAELPTKNAARERLSDMLRASTTTIDVTFQELTERWEQAEGPTLKSTTLGHYRNALKAYVLPTFADRKISTINREVIQTFLRDQATGYSKSSLRSMKVALGLTLGWAHDNGWLPKNPTVRIKLPRSTGGRKVTRTVLTAERTAAIVERIPEPYATLVLLVAILGLRIGEAVAVKFSDFVDGVLHVSRRLYEGDIDDLKTRRQPPRAPEVYDHVSVEEMRKPRAAIADQLLPTVTKNGSVN